MIKNSVTFYCLSILFNCSEEINTTSYPFFIIKKNNYKEGRGGVTKFYSM